MLKLGTLSRRPITALTGWPGAGGARRTVTVTGVGAVGSAMRMVIVVGNARVRVMARLEGVGSV
jgi:hypothetical protein